jgi:putative tryptophan/tyrosine transport system substrate-binding protein
MFEPIQCWPLSLGTVMRRRESITLLGGAAAWPFVARAQQPAMPVIGFLSSQYLEGYREPLRGFRQGLKESGYIEGENVAIEYRWAENQTDQLLALAAELIHRRVAVMTAMDSPTVLAAKAATTTIPLVFSTGEDPVRLGLVTSLARPGGNLTGVNFFAAELAAKRLGLLRELVPGATRIAVIVNPDHASITESTLRDLEPAAHAAGLQVQVLSASSGAEIAAAFATSARERFDGLLLGSDPFFGNRRVQLALLAARYAVPTMYTGRQYVKAGGLISYGTSLTDAWRQVGTYAGQILKGAKPADLPVVQSSKFELAINTEAARILGLTVPASLLAVADEVIE